MSTASKSTTRSSSSSSLPPTRRRRHLGNGGGGGAAASSLSPVARSTRSTRSTRSSAKRKRDDDTDAAGGGTGTGSGSGSGSSDGGEDDVGQRRQKRQRRTSPTGSASAAAASVAKKKTKKTKKKRPQDANDADEDTDGGELKVGTTLTFGGHGSSSGGNGGNQIVNDENMSGNAHNMSITVRIVRTLGSGAHGRVYLASEQTGGDDGNGDDDKTKYVLKVPMATEEDVREAQIEIRALEALKGVSGVVQLVAASSTVSTGTGGGGSSSSDTVCLLLKHVEGQVMEEYIEQRGRLPLSEAWGLMKQLVSTLVEMKKKAGLCHLDIKPDNCLVTTTATTGTSKDQRLVLFDYGTARPCDRPTSDDLGSIFFDAPEICRGQKKTAREPYDPMPADMYSVARTFLVALVGYHPRSSSSDKAGGGGEEGDWWEEDTFGTVGEHIGSIRERCPAAADLLEQLLRSDPTQRPTAEQALEALTNRPWE